MKKTGKVLSFILAVIMMFGSFGVISFGATQKKAYNKKYGYIEPRDKTFSKQIESVTLYGDRDYMYFYQMSCGKKNVHYIFSITSKDNKVVFQDEAPVVAKNEYGYAYLSEVDLSGIKSGTYTGSCLTYIQSGDKNIVDTDAAKYFTVKIDRSTKSIKNQIVCISTLDQTRNTVNGPQIKWYPVKGASKYIIYRKPVTGGPWKAIGSVGSGKTAYCDKSLKNSVGEYYYTVKARNAAGNNSRYFEIYSEKIGSYMCAVAAPQAASAVVGADNKITVKWNSTKGAEGYYVFRKAGKGKYDNGVFVKGKTTYVDTTEKESGVKYTYTVKAYYRGYLSSCYSEGKSALFAAAPVFKSVKSVKNGVELKWGACAGAADYTVYRKVAGTKGWKPLSAVAGTKFIDDSAVSGTDYVYTVRAEGEDARGSYSSEGTSLIFLAEPVVTLEKATVSGKKGVKIKWDEVDGALSYKVYVKAAGETNWSWVDKNCKTTEAFAQTKAGVEYKFAVKAANGSYTSSYTAVSITT